IDLVKEAVAVVLGVEDEFVERKDVTDGRTGSFKTYTDISRVVVTGAGLALQVFAPRYGRIGEALALPGTTLLVKSVAKAVAPVTTTAASMGFTPNRTAPAPAPAAARNYRRSYEPEFAPVGAI
ncbi:MAG: hypothetical protein Q8S53_15865, partial [Brevundimonas sp.]|uniref:hypothetical protein n=1 Tax=Brevundimonas sp. TaxID=1871086 RepID=UPI002735F0A6